MRIYTGKGVYGAIAIGKISIFSRQQIAITKLHIEDIDAEKARVQAAKEKSIFRVSKIGAINKANIFKIPLAFKIDITLEKITTNPPINNIVEILLIILSDKIEPRLEKVIFSFEAEL